MATIALTRPFTLKNATLTIASDDFSLAISEVRFSPSVQTATWRGMRGNVVKDQSSAEWSATIGYAQDLAATGFSRYLHDHEQESKHVVFTPDDGEGPDVEAELIITPGDIGASGTDWATATVTLAVSGRPEFVDTP